MDQLSPIIWTANYYGAFIALNIKNYVMAEEMASLTASDEEVFTVIAIMRDAKEGDRIYPALTWLRKQRKVKYP